MYLPEGCIVKYPLRGKIWSQLQVLFELLISETAPMTETLTRPLNEQQMSDFQRDGFIVVRGLFSHDEAVAIRDVFMDMAKDGPVKGLSEMSRTQVDGKVGGYDPSDPLSFYPRMMNPHTHDAKPVGPLSMRYMTDPRVEAMLAQLMDEPPFAVQSMFYFKPPGARGQDFHQDNFYLRVKPGTCMAAWVALDECDIDNGGMMCVPDTGSYPTQCPTKADPKLYFTIHHVDIPEGKTAVLPLLKPGDVLFFNGQTISARVPMSAKTASADLLFAITSPRARPR